MNGSLKKEYMFEKEYYKEKEKKKLRKKRKKIKRKSLILKKFIYIPTQETNQEKRGGMPIHSNCFCFTLLLNLSLYRC
jgi:hypothetical protein